jgi:hypothetical protein
MSEPAAIWSPQTIVFDRSICSAQNVILSHARYALQGLIKRIDRLPQLVAESLPIVNVHIHGDLPTLLSDLCFQQGLASTILFNDSPKSARENRAAYAQRLARVAYVRRKCSRISTALLQDRQIRNSLTHIDEHLAKALSKENTGWFIDCAILDREATSNPHGLDVAFCRSYISSENVILHLGHEISLTALRQEASGVLTAIWSEPPH